MRERPAEDARVEPGSAAHVLLVEDDRDLQAALAERLGSLGLPSVHGLDYLSYLSESTDIPTVVLTGAEGEVVRRARELRPAGLLHEPARSRDLVSALRYAVSVGRGGKPLEGSAR